MKLGLYGMCLGAMATPEAADIAVMAEELGYESLWTGEHMALPDPQAPPSHRAPTHPFLDPLIGMTFLAAHTRRIKLGFGILLLPQRHPVQLAKELASLDVLSRGRLLVGVGVGYLEPEMRAVGVDFESRGARTDEHLEALQSLWNDEHPAFEGKFVQFRGIDAHPRPATKGGPPVLVGGHSKAALRRVVSHGQGWLAFGLEPDEVRAKRDQLRALAADAGVAHSSLEITVTIRGEPSADVMTQYAQAGVHRLVIKAEGASLDDVAQIVRRCAP